MTDWMTQTQAGIDRWIGAQHEWWTSLLRGASGATQAPSANVVEGLQRQTVEAWRRAAHGIVDAQAEMLLAAARQQSRGDTEALIRRWTDAQREMWQGWLAVAGQSRADDTPGLASAGEHMAASLRQGAEQLVKSQAEWARAWTASQQAPGAERTS